MGLFTGAGDSRFEEFRRQHKDLAVHTIWVASALFLRIFSFFFFAAGIRYAAVVLAFLCMVAATMAIRAETWKWGWLKGFKNAQEMRELGGFKMHEVSSMPGLAEARMRWSKFLSGFSARVLWASGLWHIVRWVIAGMPS